MRRRDLADGFRPTERCAREQEGLWLLEQTRDIGSANNIPVGLRLRGHLDIPALVRALEALVARHPTLRTELAPVGGTLVRREYGASAVRPEVLDARDRGDADRLVAECSRARIHPTRRPPFRFSVIRRSADEHVLLLVFHHCVFDGGSVDPAIGEVARLYTALVTDEPVDLGPPPPRYDDYVAAEQAAIAELAGRAAAYWEPTLAAVEESLRIPTRLGSAPDAHGASACVAFELGGEVKAGLEGLAHEHGASPFAALLAVLQVLQFRYAGGGGGGVATAVAMDARPRAMRDAIGMFANEAPLFSTPAAHTTFADFLEAVRDGMKRLFALRRFPFTEALARFGRSGAREAAAQVGVTYLRSGRRAISMPGLDVEPLGILPSFGSRRPLTLWLVDEPGRVAGRLDYDTALILPDTARGIARHFSALVASALERPDGALGQLELMGPGERRRIVREWSVGEVVADEPANVVALVQRQARRTPGARAVELGGRSLGYADLNARANRLAHHLRRLGAAPDVPVALCVERSLELVVGLLAILKAGAAYLPLDPDYPRERLRLMLENARAPIVVTNEGLRSRLPQTRGRLLLLDRAAAAIAAEPADDPRPLANPSSLAYVIYTSGSTGVPKGVAMPHAALANLLEWQRRSFRRQGPARTLQFASASFDVAFQDIFSTLATGGCVVLIPEDLRRDFERLAALVDEARIERLFVPFLALNELARHLGRRPVVAGAVEVIAAGERLEITPQIRDLWRRRPRWTLTNQYGPTETHVVTAHPLEAGAGADWPSLPPIGRPIANARVYVLDRQRAPVPAGIPGELHVGGPCLARGYLRDSKATLERFVADPFGPPGSLLYRTGDICCWRPGGLLEFLGRADHQVKVRGFRVEPEEIEARLLEHPAVGAAAVASWGAQRLAAYVVPADGSTIESAELAEHLAGTLPGYMVPAAFVPLPALPLTPNGKLDRRALPEPDERPGPADAYVAPRTRTEELLAEVWADALGLERVGVDDDFFALGGHSLLAGEVIARARERLDRDIPIAAIFSSPTVARLAAAIEA